MDLYLRKATQYYREVAQRLGLVAEQVPFGVLVSGSLNGVPVSARRYSESASIVRALVQPPSHFGLAIAPAGLFSKLGTLFGADDVTIGDKQIDDAFVIHGCDAATVSDLLTEPIRAELRSLHGAKVPFAVTDVHVQIRRRLIDHGEDIEGDLRVTAFLASALAASAARVTAAHQAAHR